METKVCHKCKEEKPIIEFSKCGANKDGLSVWCKTCKRQYRLKHKEEIKRNDKEYYIKKREYILKRCKNYKENNKNNIKKYNKEYKQKYKNEIKNYNTQYRINNKETLKLKREKNKENVKLYRYLYYRKNAIKIKMYNKERYNSNKEYHKKYSKVYYKLNRETILKRTRENHKIYYLNNKDRIKIKVQKREAKKRELPNNFTISQWEDVKKVFNNKCAYCGEEKPLSQEHFIPLSKGGEYTKNNIIPVCLQCNSSKKDREFCEWYSEQEFYSKEREQFVLKYLGYKDGKQQLKLI